MFIFYIHYFYAYIPKNLIFSLFSTIITAINYEITLYYNTLYVIFNNVFGDFVHAYYLLFNCLFLLTRVIHYGKLVGIYDFIVADSMRFHVTLNN